MAGKVTFLHGTYLKSLVRFGISDISRRGIKGALGRELTAPEMEKIKYLVATERFFSVKNRETLVAQDIKRTLVALSKLGLEDVATAFEECDIYTKGLINDALFLDLRLKGADLLYPSPENIVSAAIHARNNYISSKGGNRGKGYHRLVADYVVRLWKQFGGEPCGVWAWGEATPIVQFGAAIFTAVEGEVFEPSRAATLIRDAVKRAKGKVST